MWINCFFVVLLASLAGPGQPTQTDGPETLQTYKGTGTIKEKTFNPSADALALRKAMKGFGTDTGAIINILARRSSSQRKRIIDAFDAEFERSLIRDLKSELTGKVEDVVIGLMTARTEYLTYQLHDALNSLITAGKTLVDVLCTASNKEIRDITALYKQKYSETLESDIRGDTNGNFQRILVALTPAARDTDPHGNKTLAKKDARDLYASGEQIIGTDESVFISTLATRSFAHIRLIMEHYERLAGHSFEKAIQKEFSGDIKRALMAIVKSAKNRAAYFAERLHESMAGLGTANRDLIFIVVSRSEIDLETIKSEYKKLYKKSLADDVSGDTSGNYKKVLLQIIGN